MSIYKIQAIGKADTQGLMSALNSVDWASLVDLRRSSETKHDFEVEVADAAKYGEFVSLVHRHGYQVMGS